MAVSTLYQLKSDIGKHKHPKMCEVLVVESTVFFEGKVTQGCLEEFKHKVKKSKSIIDLLVITSEGGSTEDGISIGDWINKRSINVEVKEYCLSACANYIFTSGNKKYIQENSLVAFHKSLTAVVHLGELIENETYGTIKPKENITYCSERYGKTSTLCTAEKLKNDWFPDKNKLLREEKEYFDERKINPAILNWGFYDKEYLDSNWDKIQENGHKTSEAEFWTFSIEDMGKFGIKNIEYLGEGDYIEDTKNNKKKALKFNYDKDMSERILEIYKLEQF